MSRKEVVIAQATDSPAVNLALDTIKIGKQALVFVGTRPSAEKSAEEVARRVDLAGKAEEVRKLAALKEEILHALDSPTRQCERLANSVRKGVAFHHSGLTAKQRELIEQNFRRGTIKVICCTPTLAAGVDLPAFRAIIRDLKRFTQHGHDWIPVLEYMQMSGRAGRPRFDTEGQVIILANSGGHADELEERYINGEPEEIYSKLAVEPVLRTYLLSLIASRIVANKDEVMEFFGKTFWAHQFRDLAKLEAIINRMLGLLEQWGMITNSGSSDGFVAASEIGSERVRATRLGSRVAELYLDPLTAYNFVVGLKMVKTRGLNAFNVLQLISYTSELQPLLRVKAREQDMVNEALADHEMNLLTKEPSVYEFEYENFLASIKTAMFFMDWMKEMSDEYLLDTYDARPGEARAKLSNADWLLYSLAEIAKILQLRNEQKEVSKLRVRLQYGVHEELLPLLQLKNIGRVRARKLFNGRIRNLADVKNADVSTLTQVLGSGGVALDIKKQLGQEVREVPKGTRKGQTSIEKY